MKNDVVIVPHIQDTFSRVYGRQMGSFGMTDWWMTSWTHCREIFHKWMSFSFRRGFFFSVKNRAELVSFLSLVEDQLSLKRRTAVYQTNLPDVLYVRPSRFWFRQRIRFSLFTVLLRAGSGHKEGNTIEQTLKIHGYGKNTYRAINHFLQGRTCWTGFGWEWVDTFVQVPCCSRDKCVHGDRRCRKQLDNMLVPYWQCASLNYVFRFFRWVKTKVKG